MLTIHRAEETDMEAVRLLIEALEKPQEFPAEPFLKNYIRNLNDRNLTCLVAKADGNVVAFGSLRMTTPLHHEGPVAEIVELIVNEGHRGSGIGERLIDEMLALAREEGCCMIELASNCTRQRAHRFYTRLGFAITHVKLTMDLFVC